MPSVGLEVAEAFLCDEPLHELPCGVGTEAEVPLDQIDVYPRQNFGYEADFLVG